MMDQIRSVKMLLKVADEGSFAGAARAMDTAPSVATRLVMDLEEHLNVRLMNRTTRRVTLTPAGIEYVDRMRAVMEAFDAVNDDVSSRASSPRGLLRVSCPSNFSRTVLIREIPRFRQRFADVDIELGILPHMDVPDPAADISILIDRGRPLDGPFVAHRLAQTQVVLCAARSFVARHAPIEHPAQLDALDCLIPETGGELRDFPMTRKTASGVEHHTYRQRKGSIRSDDSETLVAAAVQGMGIVGMLSFAANDLLEAGHLTRVLPDWEIETWNVYAVVHSRMHMPQSARAFINFLRERLANEPGGPQTLLPEPGVRAATGV